MSPAAERDAIDLVTVTRLLWRNRLIIALACGICGIAAAAYALTATPMFSAEAILTEVRDRGMGGASSLVDQLGGIASLAGVNLNSDSAGQEAQAVLESRRLAEEFIKRNNLLPVLSGKKGQTPSLWLAVKQFKGNVLSVHKDLRKGVTVVGVEWTDAATAAQWANGFVALANELIRARALEESNRNITYLTGQLEQSNSVDLRKVMYGIIENETKKLMLAKGRIEYAFQVVDPAVPPEVRSSPKRTLIVLGGLVIGLFLGITIAFVRDGVGRPAPRSRADLDRLHAADARG